MTKDVSGHSDIIGYFPRSFEKNLDNFVDKNLEKIILSPSDGTPLKT